MRIPVCILAAGMALAGAAQADGQLHVSLGYDDLFQKRQPTAAAALEYASSGFGPGDRFRFNIAGMATTDIDLWVGAGLSWGRPIGNGRWFVEASFLPGIFYREDEEPGLDKLHLPMFRTQGVIGYRLRSGRTISLALSHHSAARLDADAGNTETIWLRYGFDF